MKKNILLLSLTAILSLCTACDFGPATDVDQELPEDDPSTEVNFEFWHCLGHAKTSNLETIRDLFNTKYAGKYHVTLKHAGGDYDELHDVLKTKISSGEVPALAMGYPDSFSEYITKNMKHSNLLRIDNFINDSNVGYSAAEIDDFVPGYYNEGTSYQFDGTWSMPMYKSTEIMYYNRQYFAGSNDLNTKKFANDTEFARLNAKVDGKSNADVLESDLTALKTYVLAHEGYAYNVPTTWTEMFETAAKMKRDRETMEITGVFFPVGYDSDANMMISQMQQRGIPYTVNNEESQKNPKKHIVFNNQEAKDLVEEIKGYVDDQLLITKYILGSGKYTNEYFNELKAAMVIGSTGGSSYNVSENFAVGLAPVPYSGTNPKLRYIQQGPSICFFDNLDPYIHKGAWLFYKELADPVNNARLALENSYDPIRISSYDTADYVSWLSKAGLGLKYDIPAATAQLKQYYMVSPTFIGSGTCRTQIGKIIDYVCKSNMTIEQAFQAAVSECNQAV